MSKNTTVLKVTSIKQILKVIIPHFDNYPLVTYKLADYDLWRKIVIMMDGKEHLT